MVFKTLDIKHQRTVIFERWEPNTGESFQTLEQENPGRAGA